MGSETKKAPTDLLRRAPPRHQPGGEVRLFSTLLCRGSKQGNIYGGCCTGYANRYLALSAAELRLLYVLYQVQYEYHSVRTCKGCLGFNTIVSRQNGYQIRVLHNSYLLPGIYILCV